MTNGFAALAEPMRQKIVERLARGPMSVGQLAAGLPVTRPAISQHLKVLKKAQLVSDRADGTRRIYRIDPAGLAQIRRWLDQFWGESLAAFATAAEQQKDKK